MNLIISSPVMPSPVSTMHTFIGPPRSYEIQSTSQMMVPDTPVR